MDNALASLFAHPIEGILNAMPAASSELWGMDKRRQDKFKVHNETRSILFCWMENTWQRGSAVEVQYFDYAPEQLTTAAFDCARRLERHFSGRTVRLMLAELAPGAEIAKHTDQAASLVDVHRCHLPIESNRDVHFWIDGCSYYLAPGTVYECDNTRLHSVANRSDRRRVHLICDIFPNQ